MNEGRRHALKHLAGSAVKVAAGALDRVKPPPPGVVVLIYHRVGGASGTAVDLPLGVFRRQLEHISGTGRAVDLDSALTSLSASQGPAPGPVVVTFDDGTADFADTVVDQLVAHRVPAVLYVATDFVERGVPFPNEGRPVSWAGLSDAVSTGYVTIGSHTHRHLLLDRLPARDVDEELDRSIGLIEDRLGIRPYHFAYPKAVLGSPEAEMRVRSRFRSAALAGTRPNPYGRTDPYRLARSPVQSGDSTTWFQRKLAGGMALEDSLRQALNRRRYASRDS